MIFSNSLNNNDEKNERKVGSKGNSIQYLTGNRMWRMNRVITTLYVPKKILSLLLAAVVDENTDIGEDPSHLYDKIQKKMEACSRI